MVYFIDNLFQNSKALFS